MDYVREAHEKYAGAIHAYCLMVNHYHLLLETPLGNLSKIMHFINTSYTVHFNKHNSRVGHLFQGRFKAILVEADSYAQELSRYIHLNPVRAGIAQRPEEYAWSSYREYTGRRPPEPWMKTNLVLGYFGRDSKSAMARYAAFVSEATAKTLDDPLSKVGPGLILGSKAYAERIKTTLLSGRPKNREIPALRFKKKPELGKILAAFEQALGAKNKFVRNAAIYLCRKKTDFSLAEIAGFYGISKSTVGKICQQMKLALVLNETLQRAVTEAEKRLFN